MFAGRPPVDAGVGHDYARREAACGGYRALYSRGRHVGHGGTGRTGADGKYEIIANRQNDRKGLLPGTYRVVVSMLPPGAKPIETEVKETVPEPYCNPRESPLRATVETSAKSIDFTLKK